MSHSAGVCVSPLSLALSHRLTSPPTSHSLFPFSLCLCLATPLHEGDAQCNVFGRPRPPHAPLQRCGTPWLPWNVRSPGYPSTAPTRMPLLQVPSGPLWPLSSTGTPGRPTGFRTRRERTPRLASAQYSSPLHAVQRSNNLELVASIVSAVAPLRAPLKPFLPCTATDAVPLHAGPPSTKSTCGGAPR
jgi:hypothetical protein